MRPDEKQIVSKILNKKIINVSKDPYGSKLSLILEDNSILNIFPGSDNCHNEFWSTVEFTLKDSTS